jgi:hypothetical protein
MLRNRSHRIASNRCPPSQPCRQSWYPGWQFSDRASPHRSGTISWCWSSSSLLAPGSVLSLECLLSADASLRRARRATSLDTTGHGGAGRYQGARQCQPGIALSYEHAGKIEAQLKAEVAELLAKAEAADQADVPDGMSVPEELARREARLAKLAEARAKIETVPRNALSASRPSIRQSSPSGRQRPHHRQEARRQGAAAPMEGPLPTDQINLTDQESRIMPVAGGGFEQCYNAQAVETDRKTLCDIGCAIASPRRRRDQAGRQSRR